MGFGNSGSYFKGFWYSARFKKQSGSISNHALHGNQTAVPNFGVLRTLPQNCSPPSGPMSYFVRALLQRYRGIMIKRVSMWKLIDQSKAAEMIELLRSLEPNVYSLLKAEIGMNRSEHKSAYDVVFIGTFENYSRIREFDSDPYHLEVGSAVSALKTDRKVVEFEC